MSKIEEIVQELEREWKSPFVLRIQARQATKGLYDSRTMKLFDIRGQGPEYKFKAGGRVAYPKESFFTWLGDRMREE